MVGAEFLTRFGLFASPGFLDPHVCGELRSEMLAAQGARATVTADGSEHALDEGMRRTTRAEVSPDTSAMVQDRLMAIIPALERHFSVQLGGCETPQFLVYGPGDFFGAHADGAEEEEASDLIRGRALSAVVFLNDHDDAGAAGSFTGGALTFYGLLTDDPRAAGIGIPVRASAGLLIVFPSNVLHAVTPVVRGDRCSIVSWYGSAHRES